ncbi:DUF4124 domain-containing protein [Pseudomaricurvus sp.]|uniref:DUF4124 domain-containing protein n=1 Tax=Pseudomaricurvus sp. TaxID=2004510 RepID=UPI003F6A6F22
MKITCAVLLFLSLIGMTATAEIYKTVDEQGNTVYTDNPKDKDKADPVDLPDINTQPPVSAQPRPLPTVKKAPVNYQVRINNPQEGTQVPMGQYEIPVSLSINPQLRNGDHIRILLNGQAFGQEFYSTNLVLREVYRGEHSLRAVVINSSGEVMGRSNAVTIYVQRNSVPRKSAR